MSAVAMLQNAQLRRAVNPLRLAPAGDIKRTAREGSDNNKQIRGVFLTNKAERLRTFIRSEWFT